MNQISVVVSAHNNENFELSLIALGLQTYKPFQVIVSDNASVTPDKFKAIADKYSYEYIRSEKPSRSIAKNTGFSLVKGNITVFMDEDVVPTKRVLEVINNWFLKPKSANTTVNGNVDVMAVNGVEWSEIPIGRVVDTEIRNRFWKAIDWRVPSNCFACHTEALRSIMSEHDKPFDERFNGYGDEDIELDYRLYLKGFKMFIADGALCYHREHFIDKEKHKQTALINLSYFLKKHHFDEEIVRASKNIWKDWFGIDGYELLNKLLEEARK